MAIRRPSTGPQKASCLAFWYGLYGQCGLMKDAEPGETFADLSGRHCGTIVAHGSAR